ncbi:hypothetical protein SB775_31450, partial [Peribacillus sp. SIMBA_075]|uniref:hypothetical protein n=1 Tax=Peribacillus sp. SIMBA_075 TaxID=3085813 RepID=UPI003978EA1D
MKGVYNVESNIFGDIFFVALPRITSTVSESGVEISSFLYGNPSFLETIRSEEQFTKIKLLTLRVSAVGLS